MGRSYSEYMWCRGAYPCKMPLYRLGFPLTFVHSPMGEWTSKAHPLRLREEERVRGMPANRLHWRYKTQQEVDMRSIDIHAHLTPQYFIYKNLEKLLGLS